MIERTSKKALKALEEIAKQQIRAVKERGGLQTMHSDSADFIEVPVWSIQDALAAAYELGKQMKEADDAEIAERLKKEQSYGVNVTEEYDGWIRGTVCGIEFEVKPMDNLKSKKGINGGNLKQLWIDGIASYKNGWEKEPKTDRELNMVSRLVRFFKDTKNIDY